MCTFSRLVCFKVESVVLPGRFFSSLFLGRQHPCVNTDSLISELVREKQQKHFQMAHGTMMLMFSHWLIALKSCGLW